MAMAAIPFHPYTGVIDTSSKRYQAAKAMLEKAHASANTAISTRKVRANFLTFIFFITDTPFCRKAALC